MWPEFEEKSYEQYINIELAYKNRLVPIGQQMESICGFDAALFTIHPVFWRYLDRPSRLKLRNLLRRLARYWPWHLLPLLLFQEEPYILRDCEDIIKNLRGRFAFNAFIQYKRPQFLTNSRASEWVHWKRPYYRYRLRPHQQQLLEQLSKKVHQFAVVVYAAPVFHTWKTLFRYFMHRKLVENSNIRKAEDLAGHKIFTYAKPGSSGKAFSEPTSFEDDFSFETQIEILRSESWGVRRFDSNTEFIRHVANVCEETVLTTTPYKSRYQTLHAFIREILFPWEWELLQQEFPGVTGLLKINMFSAATNIRVFFGLA